MGSARTVDSRRFVSTATGRLSRPNHPARMFHNPLLTFRYAGKRPLEAWSEPHASWFDRETRCGSRELQPERQARTDPILSVGDPRRYSNWMARIRRGFRRAHSTNAR